MVATTARHAVQPRPRWWARRPARHHDRPAEVLAVLQQARSIVEAGWVRGGWTVPAARTPDLPVARAPVATAEPVAAACVVGAVALAARARDPRADLTAATGPALAFLADAVHGDPRWRVAGRAAPHAVRVARMRELARWNDEPGRTRADVVAALDRAAAAVVAATVEPGRR